MIRIDNKLKEQVLNIGNTLRSKKLKIATAESCTGGMIGSVFTSVAGSSDWFNGGIIAYSNEIKNQLLGVSEKTLKQFGAVSEETVQEMAVGAAKALNADIAVSVSGIAGPGGGTEEKPVGLVYLGLYNRGDVSAFKFVFDGDRDSVRVQTVIKSIEVVLRLLDK